MMKKLKMKIKDEAKTMFLITLVVVIAGLLVGVFMDRYTEHYKCGGHPEYSFKLYPNCDKCGKPLHKSDMTLWFFNEHDEED